MGLFSSPQTLSASEALWGFVGWITAADKKLVASCKHDAATWARLVDEFARVNRLPNPEPGWPSRVKYPRQL